uniref:(northern house mosquito) hypothetical protein n=2 Tax=Culex pipiens TaxID=7175 RepID=A0A8D8ADL2_CULPI
MIGFCCCCTSTTDAKNLPTRRKGIANRTDCHRDSQSQPHLHTHTRTRKKKRKTHCDGREKFCDPTKRHRKSNSLFLEGIQWHQTPAAAGGQTVVSTYCDMLLEIAHVQRTVPAAHEDQPEPLAAQMQHRPAVATSIRTWR